MFQYDFDADEHNNQPEEHFENELSTDDDDDDTDSLVGEETKSFQDEIEDIIDQYNSDHFEILDS